MSFGENFPHQKKAFKTMAHKILIAEKDSETLALLEARLKARGYDVFIAMYSDEAIRLVQKMRFDLILIGSAMEPIEGMELSQKAKRAQIGLSASIILLADEGELSELILTQDRGFDDFLIKPFDPFSLQLRVALNLTRARERLQANPLTGLPGSAAIEANINRRIERNEWFSVCYVDINHFKSFNDRYGFERGDNVIRQLAQLLGRILEKTGAVRNGFIGHIGGDDFIVVLNSEYEEKFAQECLQEFDRIIPTCYDEADRKQRSVMIKNRNGVPVSFPLMSLSIATVSNQNRPYRNMAEIARDAAEVKSYLKTQPGSHYLQDRRARPVTSLEESLDLLSKAGNKADKPDTTKPLGQMLIEIGLITPEQLEQAIRRHVETGERIGQILIRMKLVSSSDVGRCLQEKLSIDYVSLKNHMLTEDLARILDEEFIRTHRVVPIALQEGQLELAMVDPVDRDTIEAIKEMSGLKVIPKFALENEFEEFLERNQIRF
jgi:diguanylate cyclase (GGDEF)-like protein